MSEIDERIVEMRFDNAAFEKGVSETLKTLEKLDSNLEFKGAEQGFNRLAKGSTSCVDSVRTLGTEFDNTSTKISAMQVAGITAIANITTAAMKAGTKIASALWDPIISGGYNRALNIANAKFQLSGLGVEWQNISKYIEYGVNDTAYGLDSAAKIASQLVASGQSVDDSMGLVLRSISGVAAMTNSTYEDIGNIFTTIKANGRLMGDQLTQLSYRGLNAAAVLAKAMDKTEAEIRSMTSNGEISFEEFAEAMYDSFGDQAVKANTTFTGALSNMKAALARIGEMFYTPGMNMMITVFNTLREDFNAIKKGLTPLGEAFKTATTHISNMVTALRGIEDTRTGLTTFADSIVEMFYTLWSWVKPIIYAFRMVFETSNNTLYKVGSGLSSFWHSLQVYGDDAFAFFNVFVRIFTVVKNVGNVLKTVLGIVVPWIQPILVFLGNIIVAAAKILYAVSSIAKVIIDKIVNKISGLHLTLSSIFKIVIAGFAAIISKIPTIVSFLVNLGSKLLPIIKGIISKFPNIFSVASTIISKIQNKAFSIVSIFEYLYNVVSNKVSDLMDNLATIFSTKGNFIISGLRNGLSSIVGVGSSLASLFIGEFDDTLGIHSPSKVAEARGEYIVKGLSNGIDNEYPKLYTSILTKISNVGKDAGDLISKASHIFASRINETADVAAVTINSVGNKLSKTMTAKGENLTFNPREKFKWLFDFLDKVKSIFETIKNKITNIWVTFTEFISAIPTRLYNAFIIVKNKVEEIVGAMIKWVRTNSISLFLASAFLILSHITIGITGIISTLNKAVTALEFAALSQLLINLSEALKSLSLVILSLAAIILVFAIIPTEKIDNVVDALKTFAEQLKSILIWVTVIVGLMSVYSSITAIAQAVAAKHGKSAGTSVLSTLSSVLTDFKKSLIGIGVLLAGVIISIKMVYDMMKEDPKTFENALETVMDLLLVAMAGMASMAAIMTLWKGTSEPFTITYGLFQTTVKKPMLTFAEALMSLAAVFIVLVGATAIFSSIPEDKLQNGFNTVIKLFGMVIGAAGAILLIMFMANSVLAKYGKAVTMIKDLSGFTVVLKYMYSLILPATVAVIAFSMIDSTKLNQGLNAFMEIFGAMMGAITFFMVATEIFGALGGIKSLSFSLKGLGSAIMALIIFMPVLVYCLRNLNDIQLTKSGKQTIRKFIDIFDEVAEMCIIIALEAAIAANVSKGTNMSTMGGIISSILLGMSAIILAIDILLNTLPTSINTAALDGVYTILAITSGMVAATLTAMIFIAKFSKDSAGLKTGTLLGSLIPLFVGMSLLIAVIDVVLNTLPTSFNTAAADELFRILIAVESCVTALMACVTLTSILTRVNAKSSAVASIFEMITLFGGMSALILVISNAISSMPSNINEAAVDELFKMIIAVGTIIAVINSLELGLSKIADPVNYILSMLGMVTIVVSLIYLMNTVADLLEITNGITQSAIDNAEMILNKIFELVGIAGVIGIIGGLIGVAGLVGLGLVALIIFALGFVFEAIADVLDKLALAGASLDVTKIQNTADAVELLLQMASEFSEYANSSSNMDVSKVWMLDIIMDAVVSMIKNLGDLDTSELSSKLENVNANWKDISESVNNVVDNLATVIDKVTAFADNALPNIAKMASYGAVIAAAAAIITLMVAIAAVNLIIIYAESIVLKKILPNFLDNITELVNDFTQWLPNSGFINMADSINDSLKTFTYAFAVMTGFIVIIGTFGALAMAFGSVAVTAVATVTGFVYEMADLVDIAAFYINSSDYINSLAAINDFLIAFTGGFTVLTTFALALGIVGAASWVVTAIAFASVSSVFAWIRDMAWDVDRTAAELGSSNYIRSLETIKDGVWQLIGFVVGQFFKGLLLAVGSLYSAISTGAATGLIALLMLELTTIAENVIDTGSYYGHKFNDACDKISSGVGHLVGMIWIAVASGIGSAIGGLYDIILYAIFSLISLGFFPELRYIASEVLETGEYYGKDFNNACDDIRVGMGHLVAMMAIAFASGLGSAITGFCSIILYLLVSLESLGFFPELRYIASEVLETGEYYGKDFNNACDDIRVGMGHLVAMLAIGTAAGLGSAIAGFFSTIFYLINSIETFALYKELRYIASEVRATGPYYGDTFNEDCTKISIGLQYLTATLSDIAMSGFSSIGNGIIGVICILIDMIISELLFPMLAEIGALVLATGPYYGDEFNNACENISDGIDEFADLLDDIEDLDLDASYFEDAIDEDSIDAFNDFCDHLSYIANRIDAISGMFGEKFYDHINTILDGLNALQNFSDISINVSGKNVNYDNAFQNKKALVTGGISSGKNFAEGLKQGSGNLWDMGREFAKNLLSAFDNFFGINSPSTVMHKRGEYLIQGLTNGIEDSIPSLKKSILNAIDDTSDKISEKTDKIVKGAKEAADSITKTLSKGSSNISKNSSRSAKNTSKMFNSDDTEEERNARIDNYINGQVATMETISSNTEQEVVSSQIQSYINDAENDAALNVAAATGSPIGSLLAGIHSISDDISGESSSWEEGVSDGIAAVYTSIGNYADQFTSGLSNLFGESGFDLGSIFGENFSSTWSDSLLGSASDTESWGDKMEAYAALLGGNIGAEMGNEFNKYWGTAIKDAWTLYTNMRQSAVGTSGNIYGAYENSKYVEEAALKFDPDFTATDQEVVDAGLAWARLFGADYFDEQTVPDTDPDDPLDLSDTDDLANAISSSSGSGSGISDSSKSSGDYINNSNNTTYNFTQNNYSPEALSRSAIYTQTQRQLNSWQTWLRSNPV